ncbi:MAG: ABC transporter substrate-binding protein [Mycobacterium sp.]|nr:ABC transporter substrate-binding protein [Mycobacterium sp.]
MRAPRIGRTRRVGVLLLGVVMAVVAVGCSAPDEKSGDAAPVIVNLPDGLSVTVPDVPDRIVTIGGQWTDVALSFGVTPVGYYDATAQQTGSLPPWYGDKLAKVAVVNPSDADVVGAVAKLKPDLILAPGFATGQEGFDALSKLAPTIDKISGQQIDPWQDMVTVMGTVLRQQDKAREIIAGVDESIAGVKAKYPGIEGKTYSFAYMYGPDQISAFGDSNDGAGRLFTSIGLRIAPRSAAESARTGQPRFGLSLENIPVLDANLVVVAASNADLQQRLQSLPGYQDLPAVRAGAVAVLSQNQIAGLNEPSPNAIPYVLDRMGPALAAAAKA